MRRADLDLVVYDFDGVMTDNRVWVMQDGTELVACNRGDGLGIDLMRAAGLPQVIISTETNPVVAARAAKLRLEAVQGVRDKRAALLDLCRQRGIDPARVLFVGNDVNDLPAMQAAGHRACPADAHASVRAASHVVLQTPGGAGAIRELADVLLATTAK